MSSGKGVLVGVLMVPRARPVQGDHIAGIGVDHFSWLLERSTVGDHLRPKLHISNVTCHGTQAFGATPVQNPGDARMPRDFASDLFVSSFYRKADEFLYA